MKRSILLAVLTLFVAVSASAQRKVLVEEFTSSTCPPCASTDPIMEAFEEEDFEDIVVLKYHQNYPQVGDIMYTAYPAGRDRHDYYGVNGIPDVRFNGTLATFPQSVAVLSNAVASVIDQSLIYYNLSVTQQVTADSIIAMVTVNSGATVDPDAHLVVVVAEGFVVHQGSNGRRYHTGAVRYAMPAFEDGAPGGSAMTLAPNGQQTYRFAAKLNAAWDKQQLSLAAFVQNPSTKEILGVETNKPDVFIARGEKTMSQVGSSTTQGTWILRNHGSAPQQIKVASDMSKATPYTPTVRDMSGNDLSVTPLTLGPGEEKEIQVGIATSGANIESQTYHVYIASADGIGITGALGLAWPGEPQNILLEAGAMRYSETSTTFNNYRTALEKAGLIVTDLSYADMLENFPSLPQVKNIFWASGYTVGIFPDPLQTGDLSQSDTQKVRQYLTNGGNLAFSSMFMAGAYHNDGLGDFAEEIFGVYADPATVVQSGTAWTNMTGVEGDILGDGFTSVAVQKMVANMPLEVTAVNPTARASFVNNVDEIVGVHTEFTGGAKAVYMAFEPGNITNRTMRENIVKEIVDWFEGAPVESVNPTTEKNGIVLRQNHPNPFNPGTQISFELPESGRVTLSVQDMMGRTVATVLENELRGAGENIAHFDASDLASGNYIYVLSVNGQRLERKMTLAK